MVEALVKSVSLKCSVVRWWKGVDCVDGIWREDVDWQWLLAPLSGMEIS